MELETSCFRARRGPYAQSKEAKKVTSLLETMAVLCPILVCPMETKCFL